LKARTVQLAPEELAKLARKSSLSVKDKRGGRSATSGYSYLGVVSRQSSWNSRSQEYPLLAATVTCSRWIKLEI
jgi:hypothetical protein